MLQPYRNYSVGNEYRYGFNGQEKSKEVTENTYSAEFWEYDCKTAKRWNLDPVVKNHLSPYAVLDNCPIRFFDPNGDDWFRNNKTGDVIWNSQRGKIGDRRAFKDFKGTDEDNDFTNIGEYYAKYNEKTGNADLYQQDKVIASGKMPSTFKGFENSKYQSLDAFIGGFSALHNANPDFIKSLIIQEVGDQAGKKQWINDPLQMFHPGDYDSKKGIGSKDDARAMHKEKDASLMFANGILSVNKGILWLYKNKGALANKNTNVPSWIQDVFLQYPETFRMAFRYNASYTQIPANFIMCGKKLEAWNTMERAYIYAVRVHNRAVEGKTVYVPTGTAKYNSETEKMK
jgi:hypothetical protein